MPRIDLNADIGEEILPPEADVAILDLVTSANIACGGHAGDEKSMTRTVAAALERGVRIGAHPSYPDRAGFGRNEVGVSGSELAASIRDQVVALEEVARSHRAELAYLKPHGALYNVAARDQQVARVVAGVAEDLGLPVMMLAGCATAELFVSGTISEGFADRAYAKDGALVSRASPEALITDPAKAAAQAVRIAPGLDSICVHSDTPGAPEILRAVAESLRSAGWEIEAP